MVLVTRNLRLRCDSLASGASELLSPPSVRSLSGATPCSTLHCNAFTSSHEGASPQGPGFVGSLAGGAAVPPPTPPAAAQLSFQDWTAALASGCSNPLARPPLPLTPPGAVLADLASMSDSA